jgi:hypothetical protein
MNNFSTSAINVLQKTMLGLLTDNQVYLAKSVYKIKMGIFIEKT